MATIQEVYIALFGRPADPSGYEYYVEATNDGANLDAVGALSNSPEYVARFEGMGDGEMVNQIFIDLFGRSADPEGLLFYVELLRSGEASLQDIAIRIIDGATGVDDEIVANKVAAAQLFTDSIDTDAEEDAYSGSDAAAQGRLFLSVVTEDDATIPTQLEVDAFISAIGGGENFETTVALNTLVAAQEAEAAAIEAAAAADDDAPDAEDPGYEGFISAYTAANADTELGEAQTSLFAAQATALTAQQSLTSARATASDAELDLALATALENAEDNATVQPLVLTRDATRAAVEADVAADGDGVAILTNLRTAIGNYAAAGGSLAVFVDAPTDTVDLADVLVTLNTALNADPIVEANIDAAVAAIGEFDITFAGGTAEEEALEAALNEVEERDDLIEAAATAQADLAASGDSEAIAIVTAEANIATRDALIEANTDAQAGLTEAQAYFDQISDLVDAIEAAGDDVTAATDAFEDLGLAVPVLVDDTDASPIEAGTIANDIFVATDENGTINAFSTLGDDLLYVGSGYTAVNIEDDVDVANEAVGAIGVLEVFVKQGATGAELYIEGATFQGSETDGGFDGSVITLVGVNAEDVSFSNGYFSVA